jgi:hypothetical protein
MQFTKNNYRAHVAALSERMEIAGRERIAAIEEGDIHVSFHFDSISDDWWDVGARGAICYAIVSEIQPEELLAGRPFNTLRRSNVVTVNSWTVYFFADGERIHGDVPECYRNAAVAWLACSIRNQVGGGVDPPVLDEMNEPPVSSERDDYWTSGGGGHANSGAAESR